MMAILPKFTFAYFPFPYRGEPIRLAFALGGIPFTHRAISHQEFAELKPTLKNGQLPFLEVDSGDGKTPPMTITQSQAILRYVGKLGGLYPTDDDLLAAQIDEVTAFVDAMCEPVEIAVLGAVRLGLNADHDWTSEEKLAIRDRFAKNIFPKYLSVLSRMLGREGSSGWLVGESLTIADLRLYQFTNLVDSGSLDGVPKTILSEDFPLINQHVERIRELPQVKAWYEKHKVPYEDFDFVPEAEECEQQTK